MSHAVQHLSDQELLAALSRSWATNNQATADFLVHLAEVDVRKLYLTQACPSLYAYCVERLHLSEGAAYKRIAAARCARRFPMLLERIARGEVHLAAVTVLAPHLTPDNHLNLLDQARHVTKEQAKRLVATLAPKPDVASVMRRIPAPKTVLAEAAARPAPQPEVAGTLETEPAAPPLDTASGASTAGETAGGEVSAPATSFALRSPPPEPAPTKVEPTAADRYRVSFTASEDLHDKLRRLQDLLGHQVGRNDVAAVIDRAVSFFLEDVERRRMGKTKRPRDEETSSAGGPQEGEATRHVPNHIRREVWERDGGQCTFADPEGRRCGATGRLELDHQVPFAQVHRHEAANIRLRCRGHNQWAAVQEFGAEHMEQFRRRER